MSNTLLNHIYFYNEQMKSVYYNLAYYKYTDVRKELFTQYFPKFCKKKKD